MIFIYLMLFILSSVVFYIFMFAISGLLYKEKKFDRHKPYNKIAIYIPAYKEDAVIIDSVKNVLKQKYHILNHKFYDVIVIAQHLNKTTLDELQKLDCKVVIYNVENSTKVKALQYAITQVDPIYKNYSASLILDADNHLAKNYLLKINDALVSGYDVIQTHRTAKNLNTSFAYLDAIAEELNNNIFRKGFNFFKLSASIIGSGIVIKNSIFVERINDCNAIAGFDKDIDNELVKRHNYILYLHSAIVFDEKVQNQQVYEKQRTRWVDAQIKMAKKYTWDALKTLHKTNNVDYLFKALQNILPPRIILLGVLFILPIILFFINSFVFNISLVLLSMYLFSLIISVPKKLWSYQLIKAFLKLPNAFWSMLKSWFKTKESSKKFIHTPHGID